MLRNLTIRILRHMVPLPELIYVQSKVFNMDACEIRDSLVGHHFSKEDIDFYLVKKGLTENHEIIPKSVIKTLYGRNNGKHSRDSFHYTLLNAGFTEEELKAIQDLDKSDQVRSGESQNKSSDL